MPNPAEEVAKSGKEVATKKAGPLPVWAWAVGIVVVGGVVYYVFLRQSGDSAAVDQSGFLGGLPGVGGGGSGVGGGGSGGGVGGGGGLPDIVNGATSTVAPAALTNAQWLEKAVSAVEAGIPGLSPGLARRYLIEYLGGSSPQGNAGARGLFDQVVQAARQAIGDAPSPQQYNPNLNAYVNNITWLNDAFSFLGNAAPANVRNELTNLFYGTNTTISQAAATALENLRAQLGNEPLPTAYTIAQAVAPAPAAPVPAGTPAPVSVPAIVKGFGETIFRLAGDTGVDVRLRRISDFVNGGFEADLADTTSWQVFQKGRVQYTGNVGAGRTGYYLLDEANNVLGELNPEQLKAFLAPNPPAPANGVQGPGRWVN